MTLRSRPALRAALGVGLATLSAVALAQGPGMPPPTVEIAEVREEMLGETIYLVGDLQSTRQAVIGTEVSGRVAEVFVDEGTVVDAGDPLIRLDTWQLELQLARDEARLAAAQARQSLFATGLRSGEIDQARAELAEKRASLLSARVDYESQMTLHEEGIVSDTEFAAVEAAFEAARAQVENAEAALRLATEGYRQEEIAEASAQVAEIEAELGLTRERLQRATVTAPFSAQVARVIVEMGEWIEEGGDVAEMIGRGEGTLEVIVDVPERSMPEVVVGQEAQLLFDAFPNQTFAGVVSGFEPIADLTNRTYPVHVRVTGPADRILPGMFTRVAVDTSEPAATLLMPSDALIDRGRGPEVWAVGEGLEGLTVNPQRIEIGRRRGADIEVLNGLAAGDRVVVAGMEFLFPGGPVSLAGAGEPPAAAGPAPE